MEKEVIIMKKRNCLFLLFILVLVLSGMSGIVFAQAEEKPRIKTAWSTEEFTEDYLQLWKLLDENYPFFPVLEQQGINPDTLKAEYLSCVRACSDINEYCRIIRDLFSRMGNPAHLELFGNDRYEEYQDLIRDGVITCDSRTYQLMQDGQTAATYSLFAVPQHKDARRTQPAGCSYDAENRILILNIPSFQQELIEQDAAILTDAVREHPDVKDIIFDIRGNKGGSMYYWMSNLVAPFGQEYCYRESIYLSLTEVNRQYGLDRSAKPLSRSEGALPSFADELGFTHLYEREIRIPEGTYEGDIISCNADRWVLTDGAVFSSADSFVSFCKKSGFATVVGTRTRGDGDSISPCLVRLPVTGLLVRFSTTTCANEDGSMNAMTGHAPDFPCKPRETAMDACLRLIRMKNPR